MYPRRRLASHIRKLEGLWRPAQPLPTRKPFSETRNCALAMTSLILLMYMRQVILESGYAQSPSKIRSPRKQHRDRIEIEIEIAIDSVQVCASVGLDTDTDTVSMPISISISISSWGLPQLGLCA
jgi:hypothetical protein